MTLFTGLSVFPLTPLVEDRIDEDALARLVRRCADAEVDSITALGSTGVCLYLDAAERARVARIAVEHAGDTPVFLGVSALRTSQVLRHIDAATTAGAAGVLLAPASYQPLNDADVFELFRAATERSDLPVIVYDNPFTTRFTFSLDLYARIAALPGIASIKIPPLPADRTAEDHVAAIRSVIPDHVTIGISGDGSAATCLIAGCDAWYSAIGGTLPRLARTIVRSVQDGLPSHAIAESARLAPLWELFAQYGGSLRVTAAIAEHLGLVAARSLPLPLIGLGDEQRARVAEVVEDLGLVD